MQKLLLVLLLSVFTMPAFSQDAFKRTKFLNFGYVTSTLTPEDEEGLDSNYGFSFTTGNRYWLHKKPIAGILKFGIDALWFDANYVSLKTKSYDYGYDDDEVFDEINTGSHQVELGVGVGPSITVAPFAKSSNQLQQLRASLYCHVVPSFSMILMNDGEEINFNYGFVPFVKFGGCLNWKALSFWAEGRWGSANYKLALSSEEEDYETGDSTTFDRWSMSTSSIRIGIGLSF